MRSLLLVAHGSRREASNEEVKRLAGRLAERVGSCFGHVGCAFLEIGEPSVDNGIEAAVRAGAAEIVVLPYFLSAGRHVAEDIPAEVERKRCKHPGVRIRIAPYLGQADDLLRILLDLSDQCAPDGPVSGRGSRLQPETGATSMQLQTEARAIESFREHPRVLRLECGVQHYEWGDPDVIPAILGQPNPSKRPFAELWAGAHADLPSRAIVDGVRVPLDRLMRGAAREIMGPVLASRFHGELPFLLKILAAAKPLSIQAHPSRSQALLGFERENLEGVPLDAAVRNYRDPNHKPELLVALSEFHALSGFRPLEEIERTLASTAELAPLPCNGLRDAEALAALYQHIMRLDQHAVNALLGPLIERLEREERQTARRPRDRAYWILRAHREFSMPGRLDRGLLSILLLNLVRLRPGQALFLAAGELHAYLQGVGIEIMANSNNVLRGGLTTKHVDPGELLHVLNFRGGPGEVLEPLSWSEEPGLDEYETPTTEFALGHLRLDPGRARTLQPGEMRLALITEGPVDIVAQDPLPLKVRPGEALLIPAGLGGAISTPEGAQLWMAKVPGYGAGTPSRWI